MYFVIINYMALSIGISVGVVKISEFQIYGISEPQGKPFQKQIGLPNCVINVSTILVKRYYNPWLSPLLQLNIIISQFFRTLVYFHQDHPTSRKNYPYRMFCPR